FRQMQADGEFKSRYVLWDLQRRVARMVFPDPDNSGWIEWPFYSNDGQFIFAKRGSRETGRRILPWWDLNGREIATIQFIANQEWKRAETSQALVNSDRILVTFDSENEYYAGTPIADGWLFRGGCRFWDVATGKQLGE